MTQIQIDNVPMEVREGMDGDGRAVTYFVPQVQGLSLEAIVALSRSIDDVPCRGRRVLASAAAFAP